MPQITNVGTTYDAVQLSKELGFFVADFTAAIIAIEMRLFVNKGASTAQAGIVSWQLWNHTDGVEIGVINDPVGSPTGDKWLVAAGDGTAGNGIGANSIVVARFPLNLTGLKMLRLRCKSTVAADDPWFYGVNYRLIRG